MFAAELRNITKTFRGIKANNDISLCVRAGTIQALIGENGAGKSTLMRILYGMYKPDNGTIIIHNNDVSLSSPSDAIALGIGMVHQHFMLIPEFTVTENIILGHEPTLSFNRVHVKQAQERIRTIIQEYHFTVDPEALIKDIPVGLQQRVEILKILFRNADILILDEPTAVLTPQETQDLFATIKLLRNLGKTIILITHKLDEIMDVSDDVTVLRRGSVVFQSATASTNKTELTQHMIGRELHSVQTAPSLCSGQILQVEHVSLTDKHRLHLLNDISFAIDRGEILGIAGVEGNGQLQLIEVLTGSRRPSQGTIRLNGKDVLSESRSRSFAHIPEDRHKQGLVLDFSIEENMILGRQRENLFNSAFSLDQKHISAFASEVVKAYDVRASSMQQPVRGLSGGNQQKIVVGRELTKEVPLIVACHPTRGLDIGATEFVHESILAARNEGKAILLVSSDLTELLTLSDRIAVMFKGEIVTIRDARKCTEFDLGLYMSGALKKSA